MGVIDSLGKAAQALESAASVHRNATYFHKTVKEAVKPKPCTDCGKRGFVMVCPKTGKVGQWLVFKGLAPVGTTVTLWSDVHRETKPLYPDPKTGEWNRTLYFSNVGEYLIVAKSSVKGVDQVKCLVTIT